jgi:hypothetical protein
MTVPPPLLDDYVQGTRTAAKIINIDESSALIAATARMEANMNIINRSSDSGRQHTPTNKMTKTKQQFVFDHADDLQWQENRIRARQQKRQRLRLRDTIHAYTSLQQKQQQKQIERDYIAATVAIMSSYRGHCALAAAASRIIHDVQRYIL